MTPRIGSGTPGCPFGARTASRLVSVAGLAWLAFGCTGGSAPAHDGGGPPYSTDAGPASGRDAALPRQDAALSRQDAAVQLDGGPAPAFNPALAADAEDALRRAADFFRHEAVQQGGYVWTYTPDLSQRWAEGEATADQISVQEPGTPAIGEILLRTYEVTGDPSYLADAVATARALVYGQLRSGGWTNWIDFDSSGSRVAVYRNGQGSGRDVSSLDDGITQNALRFLMRVEQASGTPDPQVSDAASYAMNALLEAQLDNGSFPQVWYEGSKISVATVPASFEIPYPRVSEYPDYWHLPTLNDNVAGTVARTLLFRWNAYGDSAARDALLRLADFLVMAQLPAPQQGWAQQYTPEMRPAWARWFEPPAITGWESQDVMKTLLLAYEEEPDPAYLTAVDQGLRYFSPLRNTDDTLHRYFEIGTDVPLFVTRDGVLTYDESMARPGYGWRMPDGLSEIREELDRLLAGEPPRARSAASLEPEVEAAIAALDDQGRWIDRDVKVASGIPRGDYILSRTFVARAGLLIEYLRLTGS